MRPLFDLFSLLEVSINVYNYINLTFKNGSQFKFHAQIVQNDNGNDFQIHLCFRVSYSLTKIP